MVCSVVSFTYNQTNVRSEWYLDSYHKVTEIFAATTSVSDIAPKFFESLPL